MLRIIVLMSFSLAAFAAPAEQRFQVDWPVEDRSARTQNKALADAFKEVIVRASGTSRALENEYLRRQLSRVNSYLKTFQYVTEMDAEQNEQLLLRVDFEASSIQRLLQESAVPMWSGSLPNSVVWLAFEENFNRQLISSTIDNELSDRLRVEFRRRGLPLVLPNNDRLDAEKVTVNDIWGRFAEPIKNASERYSSQAVVAGRVIESSGSWRGSFWLDIQGRQQLLEITEASSELVFARMADWVGEQLCYVYCVTDNFQSDNEQMLIIQNVGGFSAYRNLLDYLSQLSAVRQVNVVAMRERQVQVSVELVGGIEPLKQALALDARLDEISDPVQVQNAIESMKKVVEDEIARPITKASDQKRLNGIDLERELNPTSSSENRLLSLEQSIELRMNRELDLANQGAYSVESTEIAKPLVYFWRR